MLRHLEKRLTAEAGATLVELLVAAVVAGVVLSAAYGWLWNVGALARTQDDRAQAETIAAAAARTVATDVRAALAVESAAPDRDPSRALVLAHDHPAVARERVTIAWDPARKVLWRNASGTYVADHVTAFSVRYVLDDGRVADGVSLIASDWRRVQLVDVALAVVVGAARAVRSERVRVGS